MAEGQPITPGDEVQHRNTKKSFGRGVVLEVDESASTALVEWESHRVSRAFPRAGRTPLTPRQSHVNIESLTVVSGRTRAS